MLKITEGNIGYPGNILLSCINLSVRQGDTIFLSGPNGSGKSSLARTIIGVLPLVSGIRTNTFHRTAYVPQSSHFETQYPYTVSDLVSQGFPVRNIPGFDKNKNLTEKLSAKILKDMLDLVKLSGLSHMLLRELSGGQLQRALIARALVADPDFLLLDEPFSNLDREGRRDIAGILKQFAVNGKTLCVIDHGDALEHSFYSRVLEIEANHLMVIKETNG